jgi:C4-type Zn-finger protein
MHKKTAPQTIEDREGEITHVEQGCQKCLKVGKATQTFTKIENFKEVIIFDFICKDCGFNTCYADFVEKKNDFGIEIMYKLQHTDDNLREVIHSENAVVKIEELDFSLLNT